MQPPPQTQPVHMLEATPTLGPNNQVSWKLCYTNAPVNPPQCGTTKADYPVVVLQPKTGANILKFSIKNDNTHLNIKFADSNPIWVAKGAQPTGPGLDPQIDPPPTGNGTTVLTVVDKNSLPDATNPSPVVLKYQLNFKGDGGAAITSIEPDIKNGGTNLYSPTTTLLVEGAIIAAVVSLVISAVVARIVALRTVRKS